VSWKITAAKAKIAKKFMPLVRCAGVESSVNRPAGRLASISLIGLDK